MSIEDQPFEGKSAKSSTPPEFAPSTMPHYDKKTQLQREFKAYLMRDETLAIAEDYYADDCSNDLNECEDNFKKLTIRDQILEPFITPKQLFQKSK